MVGSGRAVWCVLPQEKHALQYNSKQQLLGCPLQNRIGKFLGLYTSPARQPGGSSVWGPMPLQVLGTYAQPAWFGTGKCDGFGSVCLNAVRAAVC